MGETHDFFKNHSQLIARPVNWHATLEIYRVPEISLDVAIEAHDAPRGGTAITTSTAPEPTLKIDDARVLAVAALELGRINRGHMFTMEALKRNPMPPLKVGQVQLVTRTDDYFFHPMIVLGASPTRKNKNRTYGDGMPDYTLHLGMLLDRFRPARDHVTPPFWPGRRYQKKNGGILRFSGMAM